MHRKCRWYCLLTNNKANYFLMTVFIGAIIILIIVLVSYSTTLVSRISSSIRLQQDLAPVKNQFRWVKSGLISIAFLLISLIAFTIWQYWQKASLQENTLKENILHAYHLCSSLRTKSYWYMGAS